jgi:peptide/nickel transport system permease protein
LSIARNALTLPVIGGSNWSAGIRRLAGRHGTVAAGLAILLLLTAVAVLAPWLFTTDPLAIAPAARLRPPSAEHWFGTDHLGRDLYSRVIYGGRISLIVGLSVALLSTSIGLAIGLIAGFIRWLDPLIMRIMDGLMAIPGILLAIALMALTKASVENVVLAIVLPEVPRVVRLVRAVVLSLREQPMVEAAIAIGTSLPNMLIRHILPNAIEPLIVKATHVCAAAILAEAALSFLGVGTPPHIPSWGNIIAEGRNFILRGWWILLFPGLFLTFTVLAVNLLGDGLRDGLDPRMRRAL